MTAPSLVIMIVTISISSLFCISLLRYSYSQTMIKNNEQIWTDQDHDLKIVFVYVPKIPIVDKPTELNFAVQEINTGEYLKDLEANVLVTDNISGQFRNFKFNNVSAPDGQFSVSYLFPYTGLFEIIVRVSSPEVQALATFEVIVPKL
ncbi:MAG: hypothetical protein WCF07_02605 [Nitrososphaeraceae archaeon]